MTPRSIAGLALLPLYRASRLLRPVPRGAVRVLIVHDVAPAQEPAFKALIKSLARRFGFVSPAQAAARLAGNCPDDGRAPVLLTFDDGFVSNAKVTRDILTPLDIKAVFFVCPGLIDFPRSQQPDAIAAHVFRGCVQSRNLPRHMALMEWGDLAALKEMGHEIGCHSLLHDKMAGLDAAVLEHQIAAARSRLECKIAPTPWFAFPFGDLASIDATALAVIGRHFALCRSGIRGLANAASHPLGLPAESIDLGASPQWMSLAAEGGLAFRYRAARADLAGMATLAKAWGSAS